MSLGCGRNLRIHLPTGGSRYILPQIGQMKRLSIPDRKTFEAIIIEDMSKIINLKVPPGISILFFGYMILIKSISSKGTPHVMNLNEKGWADTIREMK